MLELLFIVIEPAHFSFEQLLQRGLFSRFVNPAEKRERVPIDVGYTEKRWQRLLMIALAMLPSFTTENIRYLFGSKIVSPYFMVFPASFAYVIKLFYFDVADDHHKIEHQRAQTELEARHALQHQTEGRWRATLWIATHVVLIIAVCAVGRSINKVQPPDPPAIPPRPDRHPIPTTIPDLPLPSYPTLFHPHPHLAAAPGASPPSRRCCCRGTGTRTTPFTQTFRLVTSSPARSRSSCSCSPYSTLCTSAAAVDCVVSAAGTVSLAELSPPF